jgi:hypothetical protein
MLQVERLRARNSTKPFFLLYLILPAALALGLSRSLTEMADRSRRTFLGSGAQPVLVTDNLTAICEAIV